MAYLGIDIDRARGVVTELRSVASAATEVVEVIEKGERLADLTTSASSLMPRVGSDCVAAATAIEAAIDIVRAYRLTLDALGWSGRRFNAGASERAAVPWNRVEQIASHNSYAVSGGVAALGAIGVRSFELDMHRGAPTRIPPPSVTPGAAWSTLTRAGLDHLSHGGSEPGDWQVYHHSLDTHSEYELLSEGLEAVASLDTQEPITVFLDNKDRFGGAHDSAALDRLLDDVFGDRLWGPAELHGREPHAPDLRSVVDSAGWPTIDELRGHVIVVLTDELGGYDRLHGRAFVAPSPVFADANASDGVTHLAEPNAVFYNADMRFISAQQLGAIAAGGSVVRTYFGPPCATESAVNYRAVDVEPGRPLCASPGS